MTEDPMSAQRLRSAFATTSRNDAPTDDCPPAERIWDAVVENLDPVQLRRLIAHIASCPACTESWRLASEIAGERAGVAAEPRPARAADRQSTWAGWAGAAAAVVGFAVLSITHDGTPSLGSTARSVDAETPALTLIAPQAPASASDCRPEWTEFEGATYDVRLLTERLELLTERSALTEPGFRVPEELVASLPVGSELRLYVAVRRGLAGVVADGTFDLRCAR